MTKNHTTDFFRKADELLLVEMIKDINNEYFS